MQSQPANSSEPKIFPVQIRPLAYLLLGILVTALLATAVLNSGRSPSSVIEIFATRFLGIFIEAVPFLLLGTLTSGLIEAFIRASDIAHWMPKNRILSVIGGAFMGLVFPVCECGVVPVARRLFTKGLPVSVGITFLLAAPFMNPIVFASTYIAFGFGTIFIARFTITAIVAISIGLVFALNARPHEVLLPASLLDDSELTGIPEPRPKFRQGIGQALTIASSEFFEMGRYLVMMCLLAAAMQTLVNQQDLLAVGQGPIISVLVMQAFAFLLSVCSTVDSFLALAFVNTFTTGSIVAFLSFGPMVDIKSTMMFLGVFKRRTVFYLILLPFLMNLLAGVLINLSLGLW
ncbi:MAG: permease [Anaerolineae bacterium]|nr:permease [Anaerolineae bacterium]